MHKLRIEDLYKLEDYARERNAMRDRVMQHKRHRRVAVGDHLTLYFEDRLTMQYQVQEMLRTERIFEAEGIQEELDAYNPLIPDGSNWKATAMIEYADEEQRRRQLSRLVGIEDLIYMRIGDGEAIYAIADEDLDRATAEKTSAVHFLRFELDPAGVAALKDGAALVAGCKHDLYQHETALSEASRASLLADLD